MNCHDLGSHPAIEFFRIWNFWNTPTLHIFVQILYISECAMDLNFSFSPSPNKRTRQTTGLDRFELNIAL